MQQLFGKARDVEIVPGLETTLLSVSTILYEVYTTVFHPQNGGVIVHGPKDISIVEAISQVWHDESGLWYAPLQATGTNLNMDTIHLNWPAPSNGINNVYELPWQNKYNTNLLHVIFWHKPHG